MATVNSSLTWSVQSFSAASFFAQKISSISNPKEPWHYGERHKHTPLENPADAPLKALTSLFETLSSYFPITWLVIQTGGKHTFSWNCWGVAVAFLCFFCFRDLFLFIRNGFRKGQHVEIFLNMMNMHGKKSRQVSKVVCFFWIKTVCLLYDGQHLIDDIFLLFLTLCVQIACPGHYNMVLIVFFLLFPVLLA